MTDGMKSSEFLYMALPTLLTGLVLIAAGAWRNDSVMVSLGSGLMATATGGYSISRGLAKKDAEP